MFTVAGVLGLLAIFHAVRLFRDRGWREFMAWYVDQESYISYVSELDREGLLIRDWVGKIMRAGTRKKFFRGLVLLLALFCAFLTASRMLHWSLPLVAVSLAIFVAAAPIADILALRLQGIDQYQFDARAWLVIGAASTASGAAVWFGFSAIFFAAFDARDWMPWASALGVGLAVLVLSAIFTDAGFRLASRLAQRPGFAESTCKDAVLFLRSFSDDKIRIYSPTTAHLLRRSAGAREPFEQLISSFLLENGRLVAVGRPGERLPPLGAARTYFPEDDWQEAIQKTAARAMAVVLIVGATESLAWEVRHLRLWGALSKTLFIIPPLSDDETSKRMRRLLSDLELADQNADLIERIQPSTLLGLRVSRDGTLIFHTGNGRDWANYFGALVSFLRNLDGTWVAPRPGELSKLNGYG